MIQNKMGIFPKTIIKEKKLLKKKNSSSKKPLEWNWSEIDDY
jgi:hypothetical protein